VTTAPLLCISGWASDPASWGAVLNDARPPIPHRHLPWWECLGGSAADNLLMRTLEQEEGPFVLAGWSLGSMAAMQAAARYPKRVRGLILVSATARMVSDKTQPGVAASVLRAMRRKLASAPLSVLEDFAGMSAATSAEGNPEPEDTPAGGPFTPSVCGAGLSPSAPLIPSAPPILSASSTPSASSPPISVPHLSAGLRYLLETDCRGILKRLDAPILILHGERDQVIPAAAARLLAEALPEAHLEILPEGNHALLHTHPQWILEKIKTQSSVLSSQFSVLSSQLSVVSSLSSALSTQHSALSSQPSALSTQHSALSSQPSALSTQHSALSSQHSALSSEHSALCSQSSALSTQHSLSPRSRGIAHSFSEAARNYAETAGPQRAIAGRLIELLPKQGPAISVVDVGCGTGFLIERLHALYPAARILGLDLAPGMIEACRKRWSRAPNLSFAVADAETYETAGTFDLVISNLCFQWLDRPGEALRRWARALRSGGEIAASIPVARSLEEIYTSYLNAVGSKLPGMVFLSTEYFLDVLASAGLRFRVIHEESSVFRFHNALEVLRSLKAAGASFRHLPGHVPRSVSELNLMLDYYNAHYKQPEGGVSLTYRMLYFVAEAPR